MAQKEISRIVTLVHPFYGIVSANGRFFTRFKFDNNSIDDLLSLGDKANPIQKKHIKILRENIRWLGGQWGQEIKRAAAEPKTIVIIVKPGIDIHEKGGAKNLEKLIAFAQDQLGDRFFLTHDEIRPHELSGEFKRRQFKLNPKTLHGKTFGEYLSFCVAQESKGLLRFTNHETGREHHIPIDPRLSLNYTDIETNMRKARAKNRRTERKVLR